MQARYLYLHLDQHLQEHRQMLFLSGPRQCGKTTLARHLLSNVQDGTNYYNWDNSAHRKKLLSQVFLGKLRLDSPGMDRLCFDEIHKYKRWKNTLKGLFDTYEPGHTHWIVTGSARLDVFRKGQDSLVGRYFSYHLFPFSVAELHSSRSDPKPRIEDLLRGGFSRASQESVQIQDELLKWSGFPEPYLKKSAAFQTNWRNSRLERLVRQDLAQLENLKDLSLVENLLFLLPERVGQSLSINSLREELEVHFSTVKHWIELLERVYYGWTLKSYSDRLSKIIKKERKFYLWDWTELEDEGIRFENFIALHLLKYIYFVNDLGLDTLELYFLKDRNQHEVDFLICRKRKPIVAIECKLSDDSPSAGLAYFSERLKIPHAIQVVKNLNAPKKTKVRSVMIDVVPSADFLSKLV